MAFTFIHTADWQIGKAFGRFEAEKAAVLRRARVDVIDRIAAAARSSNAGHILVAGDVFDGEALPDRVIEQMFARLAAHAGADSGASRAGAVGGLTWHLLPGNHDPARPGGIWERARGLDVPANVILHLEPVPAEIAPDVFLLPAPLAAKEVSCDPTAWMDEAATPAHGLRIGLAHGSIKGFGSLGEAKVPIDPARPKSAGLGFLALGDWHGMKAIGPALWYSGTPEPDSFAENDPGFVLAVRLAGPQAPPEVAPVPTGQFTWASRKVTLGQAADLAPVEAEIVRQGPAAASSLMSLVLEGQVPLAALPEIELRLSRLGALLYELRLDRQRLASVATGADIADLGDSSLAAVAERLKVLSEDPTAGNRRAAGMALERLVMLAAARDGERRP